VVEQVLIKAKRAPGVHLSSYMIYLGCSKEIASAEYLVTSQWETEQLE
jgi:hypothetical protein